MKGKVYFSDLNFPLVRISIVSTKGGVGKSTIAISLSRELADRGKRVLLVDMDLSGFSSLIAGIREQGLISSTVDGNDSNYLREVHTGNGTFTVLKFCGDGPRLRRDLEVIRDNEFLREEVIEAYSSIISRGYDFVILDNRPLANPQEEEAGIEWEAFRDTKQEESYRIYVTDASEFDIEDTIRYHEWLDKDPRDNTFPLTLVFNMIPGKERIEEMRSKIKVVMKRMSVRIGVLIPFIEELFEYSGSLDGMPRLEQAGKLAQRLLDSSLEDYIVIE
jgi:MinD-like ATPase involved in chromosome partitioning or flagellar assembly